jgi:hypothetical protein
MHWYTLREYVAQRMKPQWWKRRLDKRSEGQNRPRIRSRDLNLLICPRCSFRVHSFCDISPSCSKLHIKCTYFFSLFSSAVRISSCTSSSSSLFPFFLLLFLFSDSPDRNRRILGVYRGRQALAKWKGNDCLDGSGSFPCNPPLSPVDRLMGGRRSDQYDQSKFGVLMIRIWRDRNSGVMIRSIQSDWI